eukprot:TRINITY_DN40364_c0_g1_i1.p1 TRINITY_DN40364_c0_g1~~TRINITY_DN40364_c0_g1_i1.p1  ORF type:complete len:227 (+),score=68.72 TRINITY_DN40364_c0_g1_i1:66-746(+)
MAKADLSGVPTEKLFDELDRLVQRVKDRDEKYYKRMRFPMGHAHPSQFWPICAEAYKLNTMNRVMYYRPSDWAYVVVMTTLGMVFRGVTHRMWYGEKYMFTRDHWWPLAGVVSFFVAKGTRDWLVEWRMYGMDENSYEIEKWGPLFPDEIELAAKRKDKYEQEYMRCREGLLNFQETTDKVDRNVSYFYDRSAPGMSGYWEDQAIKAKKESEDAKALKAHRLAISA